ncbi:MAG: hypothetical protein MJZ12_06155 [Prevotella sp.]|nr:hypothetical protein [Prevotella sp.]
MSVLDDIMKKSNPLSNPVTSQSVATNLAPKTAEDVAQGGGSTTAPVVANGTMPAQTTAAQPVQVTATPATQATQPQQLSYVDMLNKMYTPETPEQKAKRERKEKWDKTAAAIGDGISALANLYYTTQGAPNSYDGTKSMSERTRQLYDKLDKDRKENERWYLNHYMNAAKMDEDAKRYQDQLDYRDKQDAYKKEQDALNRQERAELAKYKKDQDALLRQDRLDKEKNDLDLRRESFEESKRHNRRSEAISSANAKKDKYQTFYIGDDEQINVPVEAINIANVSRIFNKLPDYITKELTEEPIYSKNSWEEGKIVGYKRRTPTLAEMWDMIGRASGNNTYVQDELRKMSGKKPKKQETSASSSSGGGKHSYRVGGNNSVTDI